MYVKHLKLCFCSLIYELHTIMGEIYLSQKVRLVLFFPR